jgi:hypothetical protein
VHDIAADQVDDVNAATGFDPVLLQIIAERPPKNPVVSRLGEANDGKVADNAETTEKLLTNRTLPSGVTARSWVSTSPV